jgi:hypothetical protein
MATKDLASTAQVLHSISAVSVAGGATENGANSLDTKGFRWAYMIVNMGVYGPAVDGTWTVEASADGTTGWVALPGATMTFVPADDDVTKVGLIDLHAMPTGTFIRAVFVNGATTASVCSCDFILHGNSDTTSYPPTATEFEVLFNA